MVYKLDSKTGAESWHHRLDSDGQKLYMVGGNLYIGTRTDIEALDTTNGALRWQRMMQGTSSLWVSDGFIYVEDGLKNVQTGYENLYRLNPSNGAPLWSHAHTGGFIVGAANGLVYFKSTGNALSALDAASGQVHWQKQETGTFNWRNELFSIALVGNTIYDDSANTLYAFNALDGSIRWQKPSKQGQMMGTLTATNDAIYVTMSTPPSNPDASTNPYISAYSVQTGAPLWTSDKGDILYFDVKPTGGVVFVYAMRSHTVSINALNSQNGKVRWSYNTGHCSALNTCTETSGPLTAADGILYILHTTDTNHEELLALDVTTGATRWNRPVKYSNLAGFAPTTVSNGMLYLAEQSPDTSSGNILHIYRVTDGSELWTHQFGLRPAGEDRVSSDAMVIIP
ncbi:MAG: PQQ-like beta-propeller repeat protein [Chloroflexota bacterium]|nr:PQQ-like beta-propeller repeat protein [Chloroflexota bacterium]